MLSGASVIPTTQVCMSAMLLLLTAGNLKKKKKKKKTRLGWLPMA
jgi:hypothetical protein